MYFHPGEHALLRYAHHGQVNFVAVTTVVEDSADRTMLYLPAGTPLKLRLLANGTRPPRDISYAERSALPRVIGDATWRTNNVLIIWKPGWRWDIRLFWNDETDEFVGWYINLQDPLHRHGLGFDSEDHLLDITVDPDGTPHWKDEDELADAVEIGKFTADEAERIREAGIEVMKLMAEREWPFDSNLVHWGPDPAWAIPAMPARWAEGLREQ